MPCIRIIVLAVTLLNRCPIITIMRIREETVELERMHRGNNWYAITPRGLSWPLVQTKYSDSFI